MTENTKVILKQKHAESYVDVAVTVMIVAFVLIFAVNLVSLVALHQNVKTITCVVVSSEYVGFKINQKHINIVAATQTKRDFRTNQKGFQDGFP